MGKAERPVVDWERYVKTKKYQYLFRPNNFQNTDAVNVTASYEFRKDGTISIHNEELIEVNSDPFFAVCCCPFHAYAAMDSQGIYERKVANGTGFPLVGYEKEERPNVIEISFVPLLSCFQFTRADYIVSALDEKNYLWSIVTGCTINKEARCVWVLTIEPHPSDQVKSEIDSALYDLGISRDSLVKTRHIPEVNIDIIG